MSTKAGTLDGARGPAFGPKEWAAVTMVALIAVAALVISILALQRHSGPASTSVAPRAAARAGEIYDPSDPTGTGPDLVALADASIQERIALDSAPVTGTGPDLTVISRQVGVHVRPRLITGTGPDLAMVGAYAKDVEDVRRSRHAQR